MSDRGRWFKRWFAPFAPQNKDSRGFKMADREYVVTAINDVLTTLNRYVDLDSSSTDFQPVILRLDYLQRLVVNLAIDDFVIEMISLCTSRCKSPPPPQPRRGRGFSVESGQF